MQNNYKDFTIGFIVLSLAIGLTLTAAGTYGIGYGLRSFLFGVIVLFLVGRSGKLPRTLAVILLPAILLTKLIPQQFKSKLKHRSSKKENH